MNEETATGYPKDLNFLVGQVQDAKNLVLRFHYSKRFAANVQFVGTFHENGGLFGDQGKCVAAAVFSIPPTRWKEEVLELTRLVRHEDYKINLTQLISKCIKLLNKKGYDLIVSFADFTQNHHGGIYQACSWFYGGKREKRMDGLVINGKFFPGRTCNSIWGTRSPNLIKEILRAHTIEPHFDEGKFLFWKPLNRNGEKKAIRLGLNKLPYFKPDKTQ
jgi:hypothetical protein